MTPKWLIIYAHIYHNQLTVEYSRTFVLSSFIIFSFSLIFSSLSKVCFFKSSSSFLSACSWLSCKQYILSLKHSAVYQGCMHSQVNIIIIMQVTNPSNRINTLGFRKKIHPSWWRAECGPTRHWFTCGSKPGVGGIFFLLWPFSVTCYFSLGLSS